MKTLTTNLIWQDAFGPKVVSLATCGGALVPIVSKEEQGFTAELRTALGTFQVINSTVEGPGPHYFQTVMEAQIAAEGMLLEILKACMRDIGPAIKTLFQYETNDPYIASVLQKQGLLYDENA